MMIPRRRGFSGVAGANLPGIGSGNEESDTLSSKRGTSILTYLPHSSVIQAVNPSVKLVHNL